MNKPISFFVTLLAFFLFLQPLMAQTVATPEVSHPADTYNAPISVSITCATDEAVIRYTTNGSEPTAGSTKYTNPISISNPTTLKAKAFLNAQSSATATATYTFKVATPIITPASGSYETISTRTVNISCESPGVQIRYTLDGDEPTDSTGTIYTGSFSINRTRTIRAKAFRSNWTDSAIATATIALKVYKPTISPDSDVYTEVSSKQITLSCTTNGVEIRYTLTGADPTATTGTIYTGPFTIDRTRTIKVKAFKSGWTDSETATVTVTLKVHTPTMSPDGGTFEVENEKEISLDCTTNGVEIRYTLTGADPTATTGTVYTGPFTIDRTRTIKAKAFKTGWTDSETAAITVTLKVHTPTMSPDGGTFEEENGKEINLGCDTTGAQIRYTLNGSEPTSSTGMVYSGPFTINETTTVRAKAFKTGWTDSALSTKTYTLKVITPTMGPDPGTYTVVDGLPITLATDTVNASIRYTLDGSDPTASSTLYNNEPFNITQSCTVKARAFRTNWLESDVDSSVITLKAITPESNLAPDVYNSEQSIVLSSHTEDTAVRYTLDYSDPTPSSPVYTDPIPITQNTTVKARAFRNNWETSEVGIFSYTLMPATPTFSPPAGTYDSSQQVTISSTPGSQIRYTTDGSEPAPSSALYSAPIPVSENTILKARAYLSGWTRSELGLASYVFNVATPTFDPPGGVFPESLQVDISSYTQGAEIRYTLDGSEPGPTSSLYSEPISITQTTLLKARAFKDGQNPSQTSIAQYTINGQIVFNVPVFFPGGGVYSSPQLVTINPNTYPSGANIRYTFGYSEPNETSTLYSSPIQIDSDVTINVRAFKSDWAPSDVQTANYVITGQLDPVISFDPPAGTYTQAQSVTISAAGLPIDGELRFTLDGSEPNEYSLQYSEPIPIISDTTIKIRAFKQDWVPSVVHIASYVITGTIELPQLLFYPPPGNYAEELFITTHGLPSPNHAVLRYTTDGTDPSDDSPVLPTIIPLSPGSTLELKVGAFLNDWIPSKEIYHAFYRCIEYPSLVNIDQTYNFGGTESSDYRLVGLPGMTSHPIELFMPGSHLTDWKAFHEGGRIQGADLIDSNLIPWSSSNSFSFTPGVGYWLLSKEPIHISLPVVASVPLNRELGYSIPLHHGWNIISNPFPKPIRWDNVRKVNAGTEYELRENLYSFNNGAWVESYTMYPYMAYYFYNRRPNCNSLLIPYLNPEASEESKDPDTAPGCQIILNGPKDTFSLKVGVYPASAETLDGWALYAPPLDFCSEYLSLEDGILKQEYRSSTNQVFSFKLKTDYSANPYLSFVLDEGSPDFYLWDKADDSLHLVSNAFEYPLAPCHTNFALVTGNELFVQYLENSLMPQATVVANNRPNPFSGYTSIKAGFSSDVSATVEVFNVRGQRVAILADDAQIKAGNREWTFDATSLPAGLYFCRVSWNDGKTKNQKTIKMIHVK